MAMLTYLTSHGFSDDPSVFANQVQLDVFAIFDANEKGGDKVETYSKIL